MEAKAATIRIPLAGDVDEVTFDSSQLSPTEVERWMQLSPNVGPYNGFLIPENVELCDASDPRYRGCGKEQEHLDFHNAQLNTDKIRMRIRDLDPAQYPPDLSKVVLYLRDVQYFGLWRNTQLVAFERHGDLSVLESHFDGINPRVSSNDVCIIE